MEAKFAARAILTLFSMKATKLEAMPNDMLIKRASVANHLSQRLTVSSSKPQPGPHQAAFDKKDLYYWFNLPKPFALIENIGFT